MKTNVNVSTAMRLLAGGSIALIAALSLWPFRLRVLRPEVVLALHVIGYGVAGLLMRLALQHTRSRLQIAALSGAAALLEICQIWIPARSAAVLHWIAASAGATVGVLTVKWLLEPDTFPL